MSNRSKAILAILLASLFGGAVSTIVKISIKDIPPFNFSFARFMIASVFFIPFILKKIKKINWNLLKLILLSILPTLNIAFFVLGVKKTTASSAQLLYAVVPLATALIGFILYRQKYPLKKLMYIFLGLIGVFIVIFLPVLQKNSAYTGDFQGNILVFLGVISWSVYAVMSKQFQNKYSPLTLTAVFCLTSTVLFFFLSFTEISQNNYWWLNLNPGSIAGLFYVAVVGTVGAYLLNQYAIKYTNPVMGSLNLYLMPIIAYITAYFLLGEKLTAGLAVGTILVFISIALTSYSK